jgi:hypothetical protein
VHGKSLVYTHCLQGWTSTSPLMGQSSTSGKAAHSVRVPVAPLRCGGRLFFLDKPRNKLLKCLLRAGLVRLLPQRQRATAEPPAQQQPAAIRRQPCRATGALAPRPGQRLPPGTFAAHPGRRTGGRVRCDQLARRRRRLGPRSRELRQTPSLRRTWGRGRDQRNGGGRTGASLH